MNQKENAKNFMVKNLKNRLSKNGKSPLPKGGKSQKTGLQAHKNRPVDLADFHQKENHLPGAAGNIISY